MPEFLLGEFYTLRGRRSEVGALFVRFNDGGDPKRAHGWFKNVAGAVVDEFDVLRD